MKVFNGEEFVDLYEERLYSTGYDELDELLEKAFCEGYEYAQREFGLKRNIQVGIGKARKRIAKKLDQKIEENLKKNQANFLKYNESKFETWDKKLTKQEKK